MFLADLFDLPVEVWDIVHFVGMVLLLLAVGTYACKKKDQDGQQ